MAFDIEKDGIAKGGFTEVETAEKRVRDTGMANPLFGHREVQIWKSTLWVFATR